MSISPSGWMHSRWPRRSASATRSIWRPDWNWVSDSPSMSRSSTMRPSPFATTRWPVSCSSSGIGTSSTICVPVRGMTTSISCPLPGSTSARRSVREVNYDRLRDLAGYLRDAVRQLRELGATPRDPFLADARTVNSAKYLLIVAAEAALDICNHLAARRGGRSPADYADCITILAEIGVLDSDLTARLVRLARFRNLLVHLYARVDDAEVYRVIEESLGDFDRYLESVGRYLKAELG